MQRTALSPISRLVYWKLSSLSHSWGQGTDAVPRFGITVVPMAVNDSCGYLISLRESKRGVIT